MNTATWQGSANFHKGLLAEQAVADLYVAEAMTELGRRARTPAGEIDLIFGDGAVTVFVEVKARRSLAAAAESLGRRQRARLGQAAEAWMAERGMTGDMRFDVALVDAFGQVELIRNALSFDG